MKHWRGQFLALSLALAMFVCEPVSFHASDIVPEAHEYIVAIDLSESLSKENVAENESFLKLILARLNFGDQLVVVQMQQLGLNDRPKRWTFSLPGPKDPSYPTSRDRDGLEGRIKGIGLLIPSFFVPKDHVRVVHTDILTTISLVSEYTRDAAGRKLTLVILSDMLQSDKVIEMDHAARMPPLGWTKKQKDAGLLPMLPHVCVLVVGADGLTRTGVKIRKFWQEYFGATGASLPLQNYRSLPPTNGLGACK